MAIRVRPVASFGSKGPIVFNVMAAYLSWLVVLQPEASAPVSGAKGAANSPMGCAMNAGLIAVMIVVFYFLILRPQQKQQKKHDAMLKALAKGTMVRTRGGIRGEIMQVQDGDVVLLIADRVKIHVLKSHIAGIDGSQTSESQGGASAAKDKAGA